MKRIFGTLGVVALAFLPAVTPPALATPATRYDGRIAFAAYNGGTPQVYLVKPDGSEPVAVPGARDWPIFSPDGTHLAFTGTLGDQSGVFVADADGANPRLVAGGSGAYLAWLGNSTLLSGFQNIYAVDIGSGTSQQLTHDDPTSGVADLWPAGSPDGTTVAFVRTGGTGPGLYVMNADGTGQTRVYDGTGTRVDAPDFSRDGSRIAFDARVGAHFSLLITDPTGSAVTSVPAPVIGGLSPRWSADDTKLAFLETNDTNNAGQIATVNVDGTGLVELGSATASDDPISWQSLDAQTPSAPRAVSVTPGLGYLTAHWSAPMSDGGADVLGYRVDEMHGGVLVASQSVAGDVRTVSLAALASRTNYTVTVTAFNRFGPGANSAPIDARPALAPAPTPPWLPLDLAASAGNGFVTARWGPPAYDNGAPIVAYSVIAVDRVTHRWAWASVGADVREGSIAGLVTGRQYTVYVAAWNARGLGPAAEAGEPTTPTSGATAAVPGPVGYQSVNASVPAAGFTSVAVRWTPAVDNGSPITGYSVVVLQAGKVVGWVNRGPNDRSAAVDHVGAGVVTTVYVLGSNHLGFATAATPMTLTP